MPHSTAHSLSSTVPPNDQAPIVLVLAADEAFALLMGVTLFSALTHIRSTLPVDVTILDGGLSATSRKRVRRVAHHAHPSTTLRFQQPDRSILESIDLDIPSRMSTVMFYRILSPVLLPDRYSRALYIDSDFIFEHSIESLWATDLSEAPALAVPERKLSDPAIGVAEWERLGIDEDALSFNSGLLLINLDLWRENDLHYKVLEYLTNPANAFNRPGDQEALNAILAEQWIPADPRWNVFHLYYLENDKIDFHKQIGLTNRATIAEQPYAIHFTGPDKPWEPVCWHPKTDRFEHYLKESGWFAPHELAWWIAKKRSMRGLHRILDWSRSFRHALGLRRRNIP